MTFSLQSILESKRKLRHDLASRPVAEKLRMLDAMRERQIAIRPKASPADDRMALGVSRNTPPR